MYGHWFDVHECQTHLDFSEGFYNLHCGLNSPPTVQLHQIQFVKRKKEDGQENSTYGNIAQLIQTVPGKYYYTKYIKASHGHRCHIRT